MKFWAGTASILGDTRPPPGIVAIRAVRELAHAGGRIPALHNNIAGTKLGS